MILVIFVIAAICAIGWFNEWLDKCALYWTLVNNDCVDEVRRMPDNSVDITLRMLTPRELYNAMGFPPDYQIERDYLGNAYPKSKQVARCGNAVCPPLAEAMVRANLPEWCGAKITTMEQLEEVQTA